MISKKIIILAVFALLLPATGKIFAAEGISPPAQAGCGLNRSKLDELKSIQDNTDLDYAQRIRTELQTRKALLQETVGCSIKEAVAVKSNLSKSAADDPEAKTLEAQFTSRLDDAVNYYELQKSKIDDLGLQGSRDFARGFKDWRDGNYKPAAKLASDFIIWAQNQELMQAAQNRLNQIESAVNILKLVYNEDIQNLWRSANRNFDEAREANLEAKLGLRASSPDDALNSIKSSLTALSKTYSSLFDLFSLINNSFKP